MNRKIARLLCDENRKGITLITNKYNLIDRQPNWLVISNITIYRASHEKRSQFERSHRGES